MCHDGRGNELSAEEMLDVLPSSLKGRDVMVVWLWWKTGCHSLFIIMRWINKALCCYPKQTICSSCRGDSWGAALTRLPEDMLCVINHPGTNFDRRRAKEQKSDTNCELNSWTAAPPSRILYLCCKEKLSNVSSWDKYHFIKNTLAARFYFLRRSNLYRRDLTSDCKSLCFHINSREAVWESGTVKWWMYIYCNISHETTWKTFEVCSWTEALQKEEIIVKTFSCVFILSIL